MLNCFLCREDVDRCEKELLQERKMRTILESNMKNIAESGKVKKLILRQGPVVTGVEAFYNQ